MTNDLHPVVQGSCRASFRTDSLGLLLKAAQGYCKGVWVCPCRRTGFCSYSAMWFLVLGGSPGEPCTRRSNGFTTPQPVFVRNPGPHPSYRVWVSPPTCQDLSLSSEPKALHKVLDMPLQKVASSEPQPEPQIPTPQTPPLQP